MALQGFFYTPLYAFASLRLNFLRPLVPAIRLALKDKICYPGIMRSYYAHLTTTAITPQGAIVPRPVFRSSAIFPVIQQNGVSSRILFMGYWILKRNIREISAIISLRNTAGALLARSTLIIQQAKTFRIELADELERAGLGKNADFIGSLEIEFFSTQNLFFPFPAVVINYYGPHFSTVVHTAQRVYNDIEDRIRNSQTEVPEAGFNLYADEEREPFIGLINGCYPVPESTMNLQLINHEQKEKKCQIKLGALAPYETRWIYPAHHCDLQTFFSGKPGSAKINFQVDWIFPRLVVGNFHKNIPALTITHTYYDCSQAASDTDYWRPEEPGWHVASLMVPGELAKNHFTNIYFYPIYSPSSFAIDIEIYNSQGKLLASKRDAALIDAPKFEVHRLPLKEICKELKIDDQTDYALRLIARPINGGKVPARIKIGLDVGVNDTQTPCNICTNLQPFNPSLENKPTSFRWSPVLADQPKATIWLMNSSPSVDYQRQAELNLTFFRETDDQTITRTLTLPPHGFDVIYVAQDRELNDFFQNQVGWMTLTTNNPYISTYYFAENASGVVGGDHGF
jgi:hypothetical protein